MKTRVLAIVLVILTGLFSTPAIAQVLASRAVKYVKELPVSSSELLVQLYSTKVIESLFEKDPLMLSELAQQAPTDPIRTPIVLSTFHVWSKLGEGATERAIESRYGAWFRAVAPSAGVRNIIGASTGLVAGSLGTKLMVEAAFGDITQYANDSKKQADLAAHVVGLGVGFAANVSAEAIGAALMKTGSGGLAGTATKVAGGIIFFLASDKTEQGTKTIFRTWIESGRLQKSLEKVGSKLGNNLTNSGSIDTVDFATDLKAIRAAYSGLRAEQVRPLLEHETRYLKEIISIRRDYYRKMRLAEWLRDGADPKDPERKTNFLDWTNARLSFDVSFQISMDPSVREKLMNKYIENLKNELQTAVDKTVKAHSFGRSMAYEDVLLDNHFSGKYVEQLQLLIGLAKKLNNGSVAEEVENIESFLREGKAPRKETQRQEYAVKLTEAIQKLTAKWTDSRRPKNNVKDTATELIISDLKFVSTEFSGHLKKTYFQFLSEKSETTLIDEWRQKQKELRLIAQTAAGRSTGSR